MAAPLPANAKRSPWAILDAFYATFAYHADDAPFTRHRHPRCKPDPNAPYAT